MDKMPVQLSPSPHLRASEVSYDARWLGWDRSLDEIWSDAERLDLLHKGNSLHPEEGLQAFENLLREVKVALERVIAATYVRLGRPAMEFIRDERLAHELGMTVYFLLAHRAGELIASLKERTAKQKVFFCSVRSLCLALGAYAKDEAEKSDLGAFRPEPDVTPTSWRWADKPMLDAMVTRCAPEADVAFASA